MGVGVDFDDDVVLGAGINHGFVGADLACEVAAKLTAGRPLAQQQATLNGDKDRLDELIRTVEDQDPTSACSLQELADQYEYDALAHLLEEARR